MSRLAVLDPEGDLLAFIEPGPAKRALARGEITKHPDDERLFVYRPSADRLHKPRGLSPEQRRRRYLKVNR